MWRPHLYCLTSLFTHVRSRYWVLGLCGVRQGYGCLGNDRCCDSSADSSASLAQCCRCGIFFPSFAIFALLWGLLVFLGILALFLGYTFSVAFFAPPVSSPLLSHLQWLALYVLAAGLHLCWSGCGFGVRPSAPSCLASHFSNFSYASLLSVLPMFVSHHSGLVAVYDEAGFLGGSHVVVYGLGSCGCTLLGVPIFVCGFFSVAAELCILSSWGRHLV